MTLEILTADSLTPLRHGFFTRKGGASSGVFKGLNCGLGSSDQGEVVQVNRDRVATAMQVEPTHLCGVHQVHSADVHVIDGPSDVSVKADAIVTAAPGVALAILTADCQPVLLADVDAGVIGAAHAGWKGAMNGVLEATLEEMVRLGASRENVTAVIGPSISQANYEVGPEFFDEFIMKDQGYSRFFSGGKGDRMHFNLPAFGLSVLRDAGVGHAEYTNHCTYTDSDRFFSYRRSVHQKEADYGRLISCIRL